MPRGKRVLGITGWAHIIIRGINRENLFYDEEDYRRFIKTLKRYQKGIEFQLEILCLMDNHVHMLLHEKDSQFANILKRVLISYSIYYNKKYDRVGPVFQERFRSEPVDSERYLLTVARYIYQNPQKAGICAAQYYPYTMLSSNGILAHYFTSQTQLEQFLCESNEDHCLEYDSKKCCNDTEATRIICRLIGNENPQTVQNIERKQREELLSQMKVQGLSVRQIARITGVNRGIV